MLIQPTFYTGTPVAPSGKPFDWGSQDPKETFVRSGDIGLDRTDRELQRRRREQKLEGAAFGVGVGSVVASTVVGTLAAGAILPLSAGLVAVGGIVAGIGLACWAVS